MDESSSALPAIPSFGGIGAYQVRGADRGVLKRLAGVQSSFLDAAIDEMEAKHGSDEACFSDSPGPGETALSDGESALADLAVACLERTG